MCGVILFIHHYYYNNKLFLICQAYMLCIRGSLVKRFFFALGLAILSLLLFLNWALVDSLTRLCRTKAFKSFIKSIMASDCVSAFLQHLPTSVRFRINDIIIYAKWAAEAALSMTT